VLITFVSLTSAGTSSKLSVIIKGGFDYERKRISLLNEVKNI